MIYQTEKGMNVIQFGTGDICVVCIGKAEDKDLDSVGFIQSTPKQIGDYQPEYDGKTEDESEVKTKLLFTDTRSIDVVIEHLQKVKYSMLQDQGK